MLIAAYQWREGHRTVITKASMSISLRSVTNYLNYSIVTLLEWKNVSKQRIFLSLNFLSIALSPLIVYIWHEPFKLSATLTLIKLSKVELKATLNIFSSYIISVFVQCMHCTYLHSTHTHLHTHTYTHIYTHTRLHTHTYTHTHLHTHTYTYWHTAACLTVTINAGKREDEQHIFQFNFCTNTFTLVTRLNICYWIFVFNFNNIFMNVMKGYMKQSLYRYYWYFKFEDTATAVYRDVYILINIEDSYIKLSMAIRS